MGKARKKVAPKKYVPPSWRRKANQLFDTTFGTADKKAMTWPIEAIHNALKPEFGDQRARDIAFHLSDWYSDAAFLIALSIRPERFTPKEIKEGVTACLIHIPNHVAAAATLGGWPIQDIFNVGATVKPCQKE